MSFLIAIESEVEFVDLCEIVVSNLLQFLQKLLLLRHFLLFLFYNILEVPIVHLRYLMTTIQDLQFTEFVASLLLDLLKVIEVLLLNSIEV